MDERVQKDDDALFSAMANLVGNNSSPMMLESQFLQRWSISMFLHGGLFRVLTRILEIK